MEHMWRLVFHLTHQRQIISCCFGFLLSGNAAVLLLVCLHVYLCFNLSSREIWAAAQPSCSLGLVMCAKSLYFYYTKQRCWISGKQSHELTVNVCSPCLTRECRCTFTSWRKAISVHDEGEKAFLFCKIERLLWWSVSFCQIPIRTTELNSGIVGISSYIWDLA